MSLTLYTENTMDSTEIRVEGPIRDTAASLGQIADAATTAAAAIGRTADAATAILARADRWAAGAETFATLYVKKLEPMLDVLRKMIP